MLAQSSARCTANGLLSVAGSKCLPPAPCISDSEFIEQECDRKIRHVCLQSLVSVPKLEGVVCDATYIIARTVDFMHHLDHQKALESLSGARFSVGFPPFVVSRRLLLCPHEKRHMDRYELQMQFVVCSQQKGGLEKGHEGQRSNHGKHRA